MKGSWTRKLAASSVLAMVLAAAACGGDDDAQSDPTSSASSPATTTADTTNDSVAATTTAEPATTDTTGDGTATSSAAAEDLAAPDGVSLQVCGGLSTNTAVYYAAEGMGLLDEISQRFDSDVALDGAYAGSSECVAAFIGGENDFTSMDAGVAAVMAASGEDVSTIMDLHNGMALVLVGATSVEAERGTDLANWAGSTLAITSPGATTEKVPRSLLDAEGVDPASVTYLPVGDVAAMSAALQTGQVDGTATTPTAAVVLFNAGVAYQVINSNDPAVTRPLVGDLLGPSSLTGKGTFMAEYPALTQAVVDALHEALLAIQDAADDPDAVLALFTEEARAELGEGFAEQWSLTRQALESVDPTITLEEANDTLAYQTTYASSDLTNVPDTLFDNTWALQSYENLGIEHEPLPDHPLAG